MSQRMLRGMAAGLGALVSLGSMAGCGTDGQVQKVTSIKIGVTVYDQYDTFVSQMMTDFNEYAAEQEEQTALPSMWKSTMRPEASRRRTVRSRKC